MTDAIVVGAGLFGATIARSLRQAGMSVLTFDDRRPLSGSAASGSLMKPSWFDGLGKDVYEPALLQLARVYTIQELSFQVWPSPLKTKVLWVPTTEILDLPHVVEARVTGVKPGVVTTTTGDPAVEATWEARLIVVAAGFWCGKLLPSVEVEGRTGVSFRWKGETTDNVIRPWAPYKQMVKFAEGDGIWAGDGTAIKYENWTADRALQSTSRVHGFVAPKNPGHGTLGVRPYVKGAKPALVREVAQGVWVATGGAKNGLIGAGWASNEILKAELLK